MRAGGDRDDSNGLERYLAAFRPTLVVLSGDAAGMEFVLDQRRSLIGRGPGVDLALDDDSLEREHAIVEFSQGAFWVRKAAADRDLQLNGAPAEEGELKAGERFRLGRVQLGFEIAPRLRGLGPEGFVPKAG